MPSMDLPRHLWTTNTTFHCCGADWTVALAYEAACHQLRCLSCGGCLDGKLKSSLTIFAGDRT